MTARDATWDKVISRLTVARSYWLATVDLRGAPHVSPFEHTEVLRALGEKYDAPEDAVYLPTADPDFDVLWRLRPSRALMWRLDEYDTSQARWRAG